MRIIHIPTLREYIWRGVDFHSIMEESIVFIFYSLDNIGYAEIAWQPIKSENYAPKYEFIVVEE